MRQLKADGTLGYDPTIMDRHNRWGQHVPCTDFDWPVYEFGDGQCKALIEYKQDRIPPTVLKEKRVDAFFTINPAMPTLVVVYDNASDPWTIWIVKANKPAVQNLTDFFGDLKPRCELWKWKTKGVRLSEVDYVRWLWSLRGMSCPQAVIDDLNGVAPASTELDWLNN